MLGDGIYSTMDMSIMSKRGNMPPKEDNEEGLLSNTPKASKRGRDGRQNLLHFIIGLFYILALVTITILWDSPSLLALTSCHIVLVTLFYFLGNSENIVADRIFLFVYGEHKERDLFGLISWHMHNPHNNWINLLHLLVLFTNFIFFLNYVQTDMPPSSILFSEQAARDHTLFGTTGFGSLQPSTTMSLVQLAPKGYYQLEEYKGSIGMNPPGICGSTSDWKCYAVGIRTPNPDGTGTWYQPLPSEGYDVDLQVAVALQSTTNVPKCPTLLVQQVTGQGNVMNPYKPIMEFAWGVNPTLTFTPTGSLLGSITQQRQTFADYVTSLQTQCLTTRTKHDDGGVKYSANYIPIPLSSGVSGPVDKSSGGIRNTIVIMSNSTTYPPFIRVTPKKSPLGMPFEFLFLPVNPGIYDSMSGKPPPYGDYPPIPELKTIPVPSDYADKNYSILMLVYGLMFVPLICIAWYYFITMAYGYDEKSPTYTAMYVRIPLMMLGVYSRAFVYAAIQFSLAVCMISYNYDKSTADNGIGRKMYGWKRKHPLIMYFMFWSALGLGIGHVITWGVFVIAKMKMLSFGPYLQEAKESNPLFPMGILESSPLIPMLAILLLVEPIMTIVIQIMVLARSWLGWLKKS